MSEQQGGEVEQVPVLGDIVDYPDAQEDGDRRWILLYDDDYHDHLYDLDDQLGILVDIEQAGEILTLSAQILADLSHRDADGDDVIDDMIDALQEVRDRD